MELNGTHDPDSNGGHCRVESIGASSLASLGLESSLSNRLEGNLSGAYGSNLHQQNRQLVTSNGINEPSGVNLLHGGMTPTGNHMSDAIDSRDSGHLQDGEGGLRSKDNVMAANSNQLEAEWIEQYEPGVYITLMALKDGTRDLKRVRFRY